MTRIKEQRAAQAMRINVKGVKIINAKGDEKTALVGGQFADYPFVFINTDWGQIKHEISWDLFDNLAIAASEGRQGEVRL